MDLILGGDVWYFICVQSIDNRIDESNQFKDEIIHLFKRKVPY